MLVLVRGSLPHLPREIVAAANFGDEKDLDNATYDNDLYGSGHGGDVISDAQQAPLRSAVPLQRGDRLRQGLPRPAVAFALDLRGPAETVATACSSSLAAVARAAKAPGSNECDVALCGGASFSPTRRCGRNRA